MRKRQDMRKNRRTKPLIIFFLAVFVVASISAVFLTIHIRRVRAEIELHLNYAQESIEQGFFNITIISEIYISFFTLIDRAEKSAERSDYYYAISLYEEAGVVASALSYNAGLDLVMTGIEEMHESIIRAKRNEANDLFLQGLGFYIDEDYAQSLEYFYSALMIYVEIDDHQSIILTRARIDTAERIILEQELEEQAANDEPEEIIEEIHDEITEDFHDEAGDIVEVITNYEHNIGLSFDLRTLIDDQNRRPANQVRMGMRDGMNEGWYNGCGWIATYNALILLGEPVHPAEIVLRFETSGGIAFGGVFGTYPASIEAYLKEHGFDTNHTLFPQLRVDIDDVIKTSGIAILAYAHTSAAHYITIEYREDIDKFIIYNDSLAQARSASLGFQNDVTIGASVDSVTAFLQRTRSILFAFSLITVTDG